MEKVARAIERVFREESGRIRAGLIAVLRAIGLSRTPVERRLLEKRRARLEA